MINIYPHGTIWKKCFTSRRAITFKAGMAFQEGECICANVLSPAHYSYSPCPFLCVCVCTLSCAGLFTAPWTVACQAPQAPLSMGFSRQEYWSGLPFPPPGDLPDPGIEPVSLSSPTLTGGSFTTSATWEDHLYCSVIQEAQSGDGICGRNLRAEA